jgi:hypothetical protein
VRFQIDPTPTENWRAATALAQAALPGSRLQLFLAALYLALGAVAYLIPPTRLTTFLVGIGTIFVSLALVHYEGTNRYRQLALADPHATETHVVELTPEGIRCSCAHAETRYPWADFARVTENDEFYLFVRPSGTGCAIPKRLVNGATDDALRIFIRRWSPDGGNHLANVVGARPASPI